MAVQGWVAPHDAAAAGGHWPREDPVFDAAERLHRHPTCAHQAIRPSLTLQHLPSTAAFLSNLMVLPSRRWISFLVSTITAFTTSPCGQAGGAGVGGAHSGRAGGGPPGGRWPQLCLLVPYAAAVLDPAPPIPQSLHKEELSRCLEFPLPRCAAATLPAGLYRPATCLTLPLPVFLTEQVMMSPMVAKRPRVLMHSTCLAPELSVTTRREPSIIIAGQVLHALCWALGRTAGRRRGRATAQPPNNAKREFTEWRGCALRTSGVQGRSRPPRRPRRQCPHQQPGVHRGVMALLMLPPVGSSRARARASAAASGDVLHRAARQSGAVQPCWSGCSVDQEEPTPSSACSAPGGWRSCPR